MAGASARPWIAAVLAGKGKDAGVTRASWEALEFHRSKSPCVAAGVLMLTVTTDRRSGRFVCHTAEAQLGLSSAVGENLPEVGKRQL